MKFGIALPIHRNATQRAIIKIAQRAEALGFDSILASDHVVVPNKYVGGFIGGVKTCNQT